MPTAVVSFVVVLLLSFSRANAWQSALHHDQLRHPKRRKIPHWSPVRFWLCNAFASTKPLTVFPKDSGGASLTLSYPHCQPVTLKGPSFVARTYITPDVTVKTNAVEPLVIFARNSMGGLSISSYTFPTPQVDRATVISVDALVDAVGSPVLEKKVYRLEDKLDPALALNRQNLRSLNFDLNTVSTTPTGDFYAVVERDGQIAVHDAELQKNHTYILLRSGYKTFPQSLVVFDLHLPSSGESAAFPLGWWAAVGMVALGLY